MTLAGFTPARSHPRLPGELPPGVAVYEISAPLFFGAAQKALAALEIVASETRVVLLLLDQVHAMDATGLVAFESALAALRRHGCLAILSGARAQPLGVLQKAGVTALPGVTLAESAPEALELALAHLGTTPSRRQANRARDTDTRREGHRAEPAPRAVDADASRACWSIPTVV